MVKLLPAICITFSKWQKWTSHYIHMNPSLVYIHPSAQIWCEVYNKKKMVNCFMFHHQASVLSQKVTFNLQIMQMPNGKWSELRVWSGSISYLRRKMVSCSAMIKADKAKNFMPVSLQMLISLPLFTLPKYFHNAHKFVCFMEMVKF